MAVFSRYKITIQSKFSSHKWSFHVVADSEESAISKGKEIRDCEKMNKIKSVIID